MSQRMFGPAQLLRLLHINRVLVRHGLDEIILATHLFRPVAFLRHLLHQISGPIVLLWDNHPIHKRKKVQAFLTQHPRLHVDYFPAYAPELNPVEFVWTQIDDYLYIKSPRSWLDLQTYVFAAIARTRNSTRRLWACVFASDLPWHR